MKRLLVAAAALLCLASCGVKPQKVENLGAECPQWKASWIGCSWIDDVWDKAGYKAFLERLTSGERDTAYAAPEFRKDFVLEKKPAKATAYFCGLGFGELYLNGARVGEDQLSPNETNYTFRENISQPRSITLDGSKFTAYRVLYMSYDVTSFLKKGKNEAGFFLGNGFFNCESHGWVTTYGAPRMICQIDVEYSDGTAESIVSDGSWQVRRSSILLNDLYDGEVFDAAYSGGWEPAALKDAPLGELCPQTSPSDKIVEVLQPQSIEKLDDGSWRVDFGDYVTGWAALKGIDIPKDSAVNIVHEAESRGNGLYRYVSDGRKADYAPRFTWYAFRTVVVKGWPGELKPKDIEARVVHTDVPVTGEFDSSNPLLGQILKIWRRSQTDNMHLGVCTDCPHREKGPYTGDGEVSARIVMHTFGVQEMYRKWMRDMRDVQDRETGYVPNGAPWHPGCGGGVPWGSAMCVMPWEHYVHYGDIEVLRENYDAMAAYTGYLKTWMQEDGTVLQKRANLDGKWAYWLNLGEWCAPYEMPSDNLVHTWSLWRCAKNTAAAAAALGKTEDAARFEALAESVWKAFHAKFYDPATGSYGTLNGAPTNGYDGAEAAVRTAAKGNGSNVFALSMGVPEDRYDKVVAAVKKELEAGDNHLNTGIFGTMLFFEMLCENGLGENAYKAITKMDYPGFGWWIAQGADTTWEYWDGQHSRNHPMFGGGLTWLYTHVAGLRTDPAEPGYKHMIVRPMPLGDLQWASYKTQTPHGEASVRWERKDGKFCLDLVVPEGCHASVYMPGAEEPIEVEAGKFSFEN